MISSSLRSSTRPRISIITAAILLALQLPDVYGQAEWVKPANYSYDEPVIFNQWCQEMRDMYGPSCTCETTYGVDNNIYSVDLNHEINCDPLQGNITCIEGVTIESARVWLRATSIGYEDDFQTIKETSITDFYIFLDDTDIGTISFRFDDGIGRRRTNCEAVFGAVNCPLCGACDAPPNNKSAEVPNHLGPADIFRGISGNCRYGNSGGTNIQIGVFNTCEDGDNILTNIWWNDLEIRSVNETGACPAPPLPPTIAPSDEAGSTMPTTLVSTVLAVVSLLALLL